MPIVTTPKKICDYVGESPGRFYDMLKKEGLPAWQSGPQRKWKAKKEDLNEWLDRQRDRCLRRT